jgi:hypothetical protein
VETPPAPRESASPGRRRGCGPRHAKRRFRLARGPRWWWWWWWGGGSTCASAYTAGCTAFLNKQRHTNGRTISRQQNHQVVVVPQWHPSSSPAHLPRTRKTDTACPLFQKGCCPHTRESRTGSSIGCHTCSRAQAAAGSEHGHPDTHASPHQHLRTGAGAPLRRARTHTRCKCTQLKLDAEPVPQPPPGLARAAACAQTCTRQCLSGTFSQAHRTRSEHTQATKDA